MQQHGLFRFLNLKSITAVIIIFVALSLYVGVFFKGCFFDGLVYSSISRNLAEGNGSLFYLKYQSGLSSNVFFDHLPLFFWLEAAFFKFFGNNFWVEKLFCLFLLCITVVLMYKIFMKLKINNNVAILGVVLFLLNPRVFWVYGNNMIECLLIPLVLLFLFIELGKKKINRFGYFFLQSLIIVLIFLTKGPNGLFVLASVPLLGIVNKQFIGSVLHSLVIVLISVFVICVFIFLISDFGNYLNVFFNNQVVKSLLGIRESSGSHFTLFQTHFNDLLLPLVLITIFQIVRFRNKFNGQHIHSLSKVLLFIGILQPLPFLLTTKQQGYYFVVWYAFFYFALLINYATEFEKIIEYLKHKLTKIYFNFYSFGFIVIVFCILINFLFFGTIIRDKNYISDADEIAKYFKHEDVIAVDTETFYNWTLMGYLQRNHKKSISDVIVKNGKFVVTNVNGYLVIKKLNNFYIVSE